MSAEGNLSQPREDNVVPTDPYVNWSDGQRMEAFGETGNTTYLTPKLARRMGLGTKFMQEVSGASEEDFEFAKIRDQELDDIHQNILKKSNLDSEYLESILEQGVPKYVRHLMDIASMPVTEKDLDIQESERNATLTAYNTIEKFITENEEAVQDLFEAMQLGSSKGIRDVEVIKRVHKSVCSKYFYLADKRFSSKGLSSEEEEWFKQGESVLRWYTKITEDHINDGEIPFKMDNNFLAGMNLYEFCQVSKYTRPNLAPENKNVTPFSVRTGDISTMRREFGLEKVAINFDRDLIVPFEIERGRMAIFGTGKNVLYIADKEYTKEHLPITEKLRSEIQYSIKGQGDRQRVFAHEPHQLHEEVWDLTDIGQQIGGHNGVENVYRNDEQLRDYLFLMHADMRESIEGYFHFSLKDLSIKEQIYFSTFLQNATFETVYPMSSFVVRFGLHGMRTFLSLERGGKELGDLIIKFGTEHKELAEEIFKYYSSLLDSADRAEELVEQASPYSSKELDVTIKMLERMSNTKKIIEKIPSFFEKKNKELTENIRENLLGRAQKDLERALKAGDSTKVEELVKTYDVHAKEYVALLQEVGMGNIEKKSPNELSPEDKDAMFSLLQENYQKTYPGEEYKEFVGMVQESLQKSFTNPNTIFRILRDKGKIVSFNRFDIVTEPEGGEKTYFGSFNTDPAYSGVGSVMLEKTIQARLKDGRPMIGNCDTNQPITRKYIESGFIATSFFMAPSEIPAFEIQRTQDSATRFKTKTMTIEELLTHTDTFYTVRKKEVEETYLEIQEGKVLTRFFEHNKEFYLVFEEVAG
jgi:hypothetical protein